MSSTFSQRDIRSLLAKSKQQYSGSRKMQVKATEYKEVGNCKFEQSNKIDKLSKTVTKGRKSKKCVNYLEKLIYVVAYVIISQRGVQNFEICTVHIFEYQARSF